MMEKNSPWLVCLSAALFFFYEFIQGNMFSSIASDVMADFHIHAKAYSWLTSIYFLANVIFLFPAGALLDRYSTKRIILISLGSCVAGTFLFAGAYHYSVALLSRFMTGIGSAFCFLSCVRLASRWFPSNKLALATGVIVTFAMTGGMVAQTPLTLLIEHFDWRTAIVIDAFFGVFIFLLIALLVKDYPPGKAFLHDEHKAALKQKGLLKSFQEAYLNVQNILCAFYTSLMNMPIVLLGAMAGGIFLTQAEHFSRTEASYATSFLFIGTIIGGPLAGWLSDRCRRRRIFMIGGTLLSLGSAMVLMTVHPLTVSSAITLFFLLGLFTSTQVLSYPKVAESNPHELTATAVSIISIITQGGPVLYQNLFGALLHAGWDGKMLEGVPVYTYANYHQALAIIPAAFVLALLAALLLKREKAILWTAANEPIYKDSL